MEQNMPIIKSLAERMDDGECVYGMFVFSPDPAHTELAGLAGFDFVIVDTEHAPLSIEHVLDHVRAAAAIGISIVVRVGDDATSPLARVLDAGVVGIIFPHVGLADSQTARAVSALRYPPLGTRAACTGVRAAHYGLSAFSDYVERSNQSTLAIGLIEDACVVDSLDTVLSTTNLDLVMPGPGDLAASLGLPGELQHPRVLAQVDRIVEVVLARKDCHLGVYVGSVEEATAWRERGARLVAYSIDYKILAATFRDIRRAMPD
ncbi:MAG: 4-hydroxy-2-oxoheptanedioate aldolase [Gammaproteobacteria bacterium]